MSKSICVASLVGATALFFATANAQATTYTLTLTDSAAPTYSGTGTLVVSGTPGTGEYCLSASPCTPGDVLTSLTFTVDGFNFSSADLGASGVSATFTSGVLTALGFNEAVGGNDQLHMPAGGNLEYSFQAIPSIHLYDWNDHGCSGDYPSSGRSVTFRWRPGCPWSTRLAPQAEGCR